MNPRTLESKFLGAMMGCAIGDAVGELATIHDDRDRLVGWLNQTERLTYTDETAMMIGVAEAVLAAGDVDAQHLGDILRAGYSRGPWRGSDMGTPQVFAEAGKRATPYVEAARALHDGQGSKGSGGAVRVAPLALRFRDSRDLWAKVAESARVTHAHPEGIDGAAVQAWMVAYATGLDPAARFPMADFLRAMVQFSRTADIRARLAEVVALLAREATPAEAASERGAGGHVGPCLQFTLYAFLSHLASFEECLLCAVLNGGDADALGAMAGAVSGAYLGIEKIPAAWRNKLENADRITELARMLARAE